jgi:hypothetical protein
MDLANAEWRKSSHSGSNGGNCVEVAGNLTGVVAVRDSKQHGTGPALVFTRDQWRNLLAGIRRAEFSV